MQNQKIQDLKMEDQVTTKHGGHVHCNHGGSNRSKKAKDKTTDL